MKKILLIALTLILVACSAGGSEFSQNQRKWEDANIAHYQFELNVGCFCAFRDQMPLTVEVSNGEVVSMMGADGIALAATDVNYELFSKYATIDRLFSELDSVLNGEADEVTVTYDPDHGFPAQINIDFIKEAADDELYLTVSRFEVLQ
jgi:Family of unknown function (DUF6174)